MKYGKWVIRCDVCGEEEEVEGTYEDATEAFLESCWTWTNNTEDKKKKGYCFRCTDKAAFMEEEVDKIRENLSLGEDT